MICKGGIKMAETEESTTITSENVTSGNEETTIDFKTAETVAKELKEHDFGKIKMKTENKKILSSLEKLANSYTEKLNQKDELINLYKKAVEKQNALSEASENANEFINFKERAELKELRESKLKIKKTVNMLETKVKDAEIKINQSKLLNNKEEVKKAKAELKKAKKSLAKMNKVYNEIKKLRRKAKTLAAKEQVFGANTLMNALLSLKGTGAIGSLQQTDKYLSGIENSENNKPIKLKEVEHYRGLLEKNKPKGYVLSVQILQKANIDIEKSSDGSSEQIKTTVENMANEKKGASNKLKDSSDSITKQAVKAPGKIKLKNLGAGRKIFSTFETKCKENIKKISNFSKILQEKLINLMKIMKMNISAEVLADGTKKCSTGTGGGGENDDGDAAGLLDTIGWVMIGIGTIFTILAFCLCYLLWPIPVFGLVGMIFLGAGLIMIDNDASNQNQ
jgi:DNA repair exonuclease SbcCD ATPase subunit